MEEVNRLQKIKAIIADTNKNYAPYYDVLPNLIRERGYEEGIEIGVFCGGQAEKIVETGCRLFGVDPYQMYEPGMPLMDSQEDWDLLFKLVNERLGKYDNFAMIRNDSQYATWLLKNDCYDFVFIDGLHTYEQLKKDLDNFGFMIAKGGVIACHDYNHPTFPDLTTAIDEFAAEHNAEVIICPLHMIYIEKTW